MAQEKEKKDREAYAAAYVQDVKKLARASSYGNGES